MSQPILPEPSGLSISSQITPQTNKVACDDGTLKIGSEAVIKGKIDQFLVVVGRRIRTEVINR